MSQTTVKVQIQQRIDTSSNWTSAGTTVLLSGEIGWESDTKKYKIGDGSTQWSSLAYAPGSGGYTAGTGVSISASNVITASAIALSQVFTAANQTAHLALTTQEGDIVVRSDENKSYVRNSGSASDMTDYTLLATPTDAVLSVNGNTGAITADQLAAAIESATDSNTFTDADHTKLNAIESSATADQTGAEIKTAYEAESDTNAYTDAEKTKLSGVATSANNYSHPTSAGNVHIPSGGSAGQFLKYSSSGTAVWAADNNTTYSVGDGGLTQNNFTDADHSKLDGIAASANNYAISTDLLDEDNFATNSATKVPSQQSVKAYVDTADALKANLSGATFTGDVVFTGDAANVTWDKSTDDLIFNDNAKAIFGTSSDGLKLHHDGSDSYIDQTGTGNLMIRGNGTNNIHIRAKTGEASIRCVPDGAVELYYDGGTAKFATSSSGVTVTGNVDLTGSIGIADSQKLTLGAGNELEIYHDSGGDSYIQEKGSGVLYITGNHVTLQKSDTSENLAKFIEDGACELYFDGTKRAETTNTGFSISGGLTTTGQINAPNAVFTDDGATGAVVSIQGDDAQQWGFHIGNSTYHNSQASGLKSYIQDDGDLDLTHYANGEYRNWWFGQGDGTNSRYNMYCTTAGDLYLYSAGNIRLQTTTAGVTVTGTVSDSKGNLRSIPKTAKSASYAIVAADAGTCLATNSQITVQGSQMSEGDAVTILNNSGSSINIVRSSFSLFNTGNGNDEDTSLGARGIATIYFLDASNGYISGSSLGS